MAVYNVEFIQIGDQNINGSINVSGLKITPAGLRGIFKTLAKVGNWKVFFIYFASADFITL